MAEIVFLIVDDCPGMRTILKGLILDYLEDGNITKNILLAENGKAALKYFNEAAIDVMFTDLKMPGISGETLIREVEAMSPSTFSVLMTATENYVLPKDLSLSVGFLEKPFDEEEFELVLNRILNEIDH